MQPEQRGQTADGGDFRAQVAADDIGVDHRLANQPLRIAGLNRQRADQHAGHVVHHRRHQRRQQPRAEGGAPYSLFSEAVEQFGEKVRQSGILQAIDH